MPEPGRIFGAMSDTAAFRNSDGANSQWGRVLVESSLLDLIAGRVRGWTPLSTTEAAWLTSTPVPDGWQTLEIAAGNATPQRVIGATVNGYHGWAGMQALSAFRFTGTPDPELLAVEADKGLRAWNADGIRTGVLVLPKLPGVSGVRTSGYVAANNQSVWVQYSTYLRGSTELDQGLVVEQVAAAAAEPRKLLGAQIGALAESARGAFLTHIGATEDDMIAAVANHGEHLRRESAAGPVLSGEQKRFLVSALSMWGGVASGHPPPIEALGYASKADFDADVARLCDQLGLDKPDLSTVDWSRIQFLAEISWASDLFGAGVEFEMVSPFTDPEALTLLRSVQRALVHTVKPVLVFPPAPRR